MAADKTKAPTTAGKEPTHWVILHQRVGRFDQGQVIPRIQWPEGSSFTDLQKLGAIRPAEPEEITDGFAETDPAASRNAQEQQVAVLKTQIDLLEKELAHFKDEAQKNKAAAPPPGAGVALQTEGVKTLIKKKDEAIAELTERLNAKEAERVALATQVDQLTQALEAATKPATPPVTEKPQGPEKK